MPQFSSSHVPCHSFPRDGTVGGFLSHGGSPIAGWFTMENPFKLDDPGYPYLRKPPIVCWLFNHVQSHAIEVDWRSRAPAVRDCFGCGWLCHAISLHHCLRCTRNHTNMFAGEITVFMGDISMFYEIKSHQSSMIIMSPIGGFHKWGYSQIIHFSGIFHYNHPSPFMGTTISIHFC